MGKTKTIGFCIFTFLFGFFLGGFIKWAYESTTFKPWSWNDQPVIVNCYGADFPELRLIESLEFWALRGEHHAFYEIQPTASVCDNDYLDGFVILKKAPKGYLDESTLASTSRRTSLLQMRSAVIWFRPGAQNLALIIEHELGHAYGYGHTEIEGHLMHPDYEKMGPRFWIP